MKCQRETTEPLLTAVCSTSCVYQVKTTQAGGTYAAQPELCAWVRDMLGHADVKHRNRASMCSSVETLTFSSTDGCDKQKELEAESNHR